MGAARSNASDETLMVRYQRGDREALAELVRRYQSPVFNFVFRQLRDSPAEELTQEVFLRVVQSASEFKHEARFSTWLYTITRRLTLDISQAIIPQKHTSVDQAPDSESPSAVASRRGPEVATKGDEDAASAEVGASVVRAVESLPEEQREVLLLREIAGLPFQEIAEITGASENTVRIRMRYALDRLQAALSDFEEYARALR